MPNPIYDGSTTWFAQDADTHPSFLPATYCAESYNRQLRGGINRTRPAFSQIQLTVQDGDDESILDEIREENFQGAFPYRAANPQGTDGIIASFGGTIYYFSIVNNKAIVKKLIEGNAKSFMHTWFCQAEDWMYIQNGYQNAIAWNGDVNSSPIRMNPSLQQMPIGTLMEYAYGRVFVADKYNSIRASDIIFGNGFTDTSNTQNFTEDTYWQEGGAFTTPSNMGNLTAMKVMPSININDRGQGELVCLTERGAFTINASVDRAQWKDTQVQKVALQGRGCLSPYPTLVNNELWFRSTDGWAFFSNSQIDFSQNFTFRKLSREVSKWVNQDTPGLEQFASAAFFNNWVLCTVNPYVIQQTDKGAHRPHRALAILDLDISANPSPDTGINFRWNGLWTGPQVTQILTAQIRNQTRCFVFSFDRDQKNRLYELTLNGADDYAEGTYKKIVSTFTTKRYNFTDTGKTNTFLRKQIQAGEIWTSEVAERSKLSVEYRGDSFKCWNQLMPEVEFGCDYCTPEAIDCTPEISQPRYRRYKFTTPDPDVCQTGEDIPAVEGSEFQVKINLEGRVTVDRVRIGVDTKGNLETMIGDCPETVAEETCEPVDCCSEVDLSFYTII